MRRYWKANDFVNDDDETKCVVFWFVCVCMFLNIACRIRKGCYFFKGTTKIQVLKNQTTCFCFWWTFFLCKNETTTSVLFMHKTVVCCYVSFHVSQLNEKLSRDRRQLLTQTVQTTPRQCIDIEWPAHFCYLINICRWHTHKHTKSIGNCPTSRHFMTTTWPLNHPRRTVTPHPHCLGAHESHFCRKLTQHISDTLFMDLFTVQRLFF